MNTDGRELGFMVDPPNILVYHALRNPEVCINFRFGCWSKEESHQYHTDHEWQRNVKSYGGFLTSPKLTTFLSEIRPSEEVLICCQEHNGNIITLPGVVHEVSWANTDTKVSTRNGIKARLWLNRNYTYGAPDGTISSNNILAIVRTPISKMKARSMYWHDDKPGKEGCVFVEKFNLSRLP